MTTEPTTDDPFKPSPFEIERTRLRLAYHKAHSESPPPYKWIFVGEVRVDSGMMMVGDPRHLINFPGDVGHDRAPEIGDLTYPGAVRSASADGWTNGDAILGRIDGPGTELGVPTGKAAVFPTNWGDGHYPVFATVNCLTGKVVGVEVRFDSPDEVRFFGNPRSRRHAAPTE